MKTASWARILSIGMTLFLIGCSMGRDEAKQGVAEFRARVSQHAFSDVYQTADPAFQRAVAEDKFVQFMTALDRKLGPWQSAADPGWNVTRTTGGHFVKLMYQSQFAKGAAAEEFTWQIQNGRPSLVGYYVNSPLLVSE